jgi:enolase-phosphatase E1
MTDASDVKVRAVLLDIEGTTTPVAFVYEVLFPYVRQHLEEFLQQQQLMDQTRGLADLRSGFSAEHRADVARGEAPPVWRSDSVEAELESVIKYVFWLMDQDRKSTALKSLQGKIWEAGYLSSRLRGEVYPDVAPAFARWTRQQKRVYIYSSGSLLAQKLLFAHTTEGDLTGFLSGYFDTTTGPKREPASYRSVSQEIDLPAAEILFLSDVTAELAAAKSAGLLTTLCVRPGNAEGESSWPNSVHNFDTIFP